MIDGDLRKLFRTHLPKAVWELTSVESQGTVSGIPDTYWCHASGAHGWLELKRADGWQVGLRPHQVGWLTRHAARSVNCKIAVRVKGAGVTAGACDGLVLATGAAAGALAAHGLPRAPKAGVAVGGDVLGAWCGPPRAWPWDEVARLLLV